MSLIQAHVDGAIGTIVMNHVKRRNALSNALIEEITTALAEFEEQRLRAVVLRAPAGTRVWSAGHDVAELPLGGRDPLGWADSLRVLVRALQRFPAPVIALIEGGVWGGACEVALACDVLVATPEVTFTITPARLGVPYNLGGVLTMLSVIPLPILKEMLFSAQPITADRARGHGMVNHVRAPEEIDGFVYSLAAQIAQNSPLSIAVMKEKLRLLASARAVTPELFEQVQGLRRVVYDSDDYAEGLAAFREKRPPQFTGR